MLRILCRLSKFLFERDDIDIGIGLAGSWELGFGCMFRVQKGEMETQKWLGLCLSALSVLGMHLALAGVAHVWNSSSFVCVIIALAAAFWLWIVFGRWLRRCLGVSASAPTFVLLNVLLLWGIYILFIQRAVGPVMGATFNIQCILLTVGFWRMLSGDPGYVGYESISVETDKLHAEGSLPALAASLQANYEQGLYPRAKYCTKCKAYIDRFDHHCPAFGNCVGRRNNRLFIFMLMAFISTEMSYTLGAISCFPTFKNLWERKLKVSYLDEWITSTIVFAIFQVSWQVPFLFWHLYCISMNVTTDEWVNWKKYPEFQLEMPHELGHPFPRKEFKNPYDKGIVHNIMSFIKLKS